MSISTQTPPRALALSRKNWLQAAMFLMVLCALWLASGVAMAQEAKLSDADETALRTYVLRPEIVDRSLQLAQDARRQQIKGSAGDDDVVVIGDLHPDKTESKVQARFIAEKIRLALSEPYLLTLKRNTATETKIEHRCTVSIGVVLFINHEATHGDILKWADMAMYKAKEAGRNQIRFFDVTTKKFV